jgi:hypothetical protein
MTVAWLLFGSLVPKHFFYSILAIHFFLLLYICSYVFIYLSILFILFLLFIYVCYFF